MHPSRLHRLTHVYLKHPLYFRTLCTFHRQYILARPAAHAAFVQFCHGAAAHGAYVGRYVLMPDHLHLFVTVAPDGVTLSAWVKSLKNTLSKSWRGAGIAAPHWQKGFFDHVMRSAQSYEEKWTYGAANPVRAGLATSLEAWPYQGTIHSLNF
ncbi:MAG: transposase [Opitutae bacterium]